MKILLIALLFPFCVHAQRDCLRTITPYQLVVVDNYPYDKPVDSIKGIKSIQVICDSVAGAYFGWRAMMYGVVYITTNHQPKRRRRLFHVFR